MKAIYKYPLELKDEQTIALPKGAHILSVQWIRGSICIYALVDLDAKECEARQFVIISTDQPIASDTTPVVHNFLGTIHNDNQWLVFHVFEKHIIEPNEADEV